MNTNPTSRHHKGFTLVEMLVVITIIVILAALSVPGYSYIMLKQANSQANIQIKLLSKGLEEYKMDNGTYPTGSGVANSTNALYKALYGDAAQPSPVDGAKIYVTELDPVHNKQGWTKGTGTSVTIVDPWGEEYLYTTGAASKNPDFDLASKGKDGTIGTPDDIDNY